MAPSWRALLAYSGITERQFEKDHFCKSPERSSHLPLGQVELVLPQLPVRQADDDARCSKTWTSEKKEKIFPLS